MKRTDESLNPLMNSFRAMNHWHHLWMDSMNSMLGVAPQEMGVEHFNQLWKTQMEFFEEQHQFMLNFIRQTLEAFDEQMTDQKPHHAIKEVSIGSGKKSASVSHQKYSTSPVRKTVSASPTKQTKSTLSRKKPSTRRTKNIKMQ